MPKLRGHYLLYFTFSEQTGQHRITEAILWLYRRRSDLIAEDAVIMIEVHRVHPVTYHQSYVSSVKVSRRCQRQRHIWFFQIRGSSVVNRLGNCRSNTTAHAILLLLGSAILSVGVAGPYLKMYCPRVTKTMPPYIGGGGWNDTKGLH